MALVLVEEEIGAGVGDEVDEEVAVLLVVVVEEGIEASIEEENEEDEEVVANVGEAFVVAEVEEVEEVGEIVVEVADGDEEVVWEVEEVV